MKETAAQSPLLSGGSGRFVGFVGMEIDMQVVRLQRFREGACKGPWAMWLQVNLDVNRKVSTSFWSNITKNS
jgi:hypothetical protein